MSEGRNMIMGWGYEGRTVDELVDACQTWGANLVVDVRLNPVSRRAGFSKRQLASRLEEAGITYQHSKSLGNPRDNRAGFADTLGEEGARARQRFSEEVLETEEATAALDDILRASHDGAVVLLCFEASERHCHRQCVRDALSAREALLARTS
ncbi:DUF488 family protein [Sanguibacter massiliensis]|uniref:DUF488 domain-containing protein n=1 Tax=Sanguibacter massiliensis TaxID=1973217 RepID=UPI00101AEB53|nr:DUF488 domain-containing protein [Sanguibacter massiliensis]